mmetsp:Transcript_41068/g.102129  ORF Transcript_41068/g.102129 Transcript_41068/m.102129 type:complete len:290 (+) Transcript_41068:95-964(+)
MLTSSACSYRAARSPHESRGIPTRKQSHRKHSARRESAWPLCALRDGVEELPRREHFRAAVGDLLAARRGRELVADGEVLEVVARPRDEDHRLREGRAAARRRVRGGGLRVDPRVGVVVGRRLVLHQRREGTRERRGAPAGQQLLHARRERRGDPPRVGADADVIGELHRLGEDAQPSRTHLRRALRLQRGDLHLVDLLHPAEPRERAEVCPSRLQRCLCLLHLLFGDGVAIGVEVQQQQQPQPVLRRAAALEQLRQGGLVFFGERAAVDQPFFDRVVRVERARLDVSE